MKDIWQVMARTNKYICEEYINQYVRFIHKYFDVIFLC